MASRTLCRGFSRQLSISQQLSSRTAELRFPLRRPQPPRIARRNGSTTTTTTSSQAQPSPSSPSPPPPPTAAASVLGSRLRMFLYTTLGLATVTGGYLYATDTRASLLYRHVVPPLLRTFVPEAEQAHHLGVVGMEETYRFGMHIRDRTSDKGLGVNVFGQQIANPVGISAGLDKDARIPDPLFALGAAVVEVGGITPEPQDGNPKPRVFRVAALDGLVNRCGLNSEGADAVARRLRSRLRAYARAAGFTEAEVLDGSAAVPPGSLAPGRLLCVQVAKNKATDEKDTAAVARDYATCVRKLGAYADVVVVNVSSPNTPGLRDLQAAGPLTQILGATVDAARETARTYGRREAPRVMVKVSPDEDSEAQVEGVVRAVWESGVDGVIVGNTTKRRDVVPAGLDVALSGRDVAHLHETGGYSGPSMFPRTLALVGRYRHALDGFALSDHANSRNDEQKVIFATGGITNGSQALEVLNAGASVAMVYTGIVYGGPGTVTRIKSEMRRALQD